MIKVSFDHHDFLFAIEGFARGSHLRQHVWRNIVYKAIPQMSAEDMDYLWFFLRRDIFGIYFYQNRTNFGYFDFMHVLAALHRGNRYKVLFRSEDGSKTLRAFCYRFLGKYRPLHLYCYDATMRRWKFQHAIEAFDAFIPDDRIKIAVRSRGVHNDYVEEDKEEWWNDLDIYDDFRERFNLTGKN